MLKEICIRNVIKEVYKGSIAEEVGMEAGGGRVDPVVEKQAERKGNLQ